MLSHPLTFLVGYLVITFIVSFALIGPLGVFVSMLCAVGWRSAIPRAFT